MRNHYVLEIPVRVIRVDTDSPVHCQTAIRIDVEAQSEIDAARIVERLLCKALDEAEVAFEYERVLDKLIDQSGRR